MSATVKMIDQTGSAPNNRQSKQVLTMTRLDIPLPDDLEKFVEAEASAGGYTSPSAYVQDVLRALWKHKAREALESQMIEAINSGPAIEVTPEFWKELKARVHKKLAEAARRALD